MIIYNVTTKVHNSIADEWLQWVKDVHVKDILNTGCFNDYKIVQLLETDETEGPTYAVQYHTESKALYNRYIEKFSAEMRNTAFAKWGDKFLSFRSVMQIVD
jgi:hypothetical protein